MKIRFSVVLAIVGMLQVSVSTASDKTPPPAIVIGPTSPMAGQVATYRYASPTAVSNPKWWATISKGLIQNEYQIGTTYYCDILWQQTGSAFVSFENQDLLLSDLSITVVPSTVPVTTFTTVFNCGNTVVTRNSNPPSGYEWYWQTTSTATSTALGSSASITLTSTADLYLNARLIASPNTWSPTSKSAGNTVVYTTPAAPATSTNASSFLNGSVVLSVESVSGATSYKWYPLATGGTAISGASTTSYTIPNLTVGKTYYVSAVSGPCESSTRKAVIATVELLPQIQTIGSQSIVMGNLVTLALPVTYATYSWQDSQNVQVGTASTYATSTPGSYRVVVTKTGVGGSGTSTAYVVSKGLAGLNLNYITANTILSPNVTDPNTVTNLTVTQNSQQVQYFDGLGRPSQSVLTQGSPNKIDIVQPLVYDAFGREHKKYLPVTVGSDGWYKQVTFDIPGNYTGVAANTYGNNPSGKIAADTRPFAESRFEPSPLNRITEQGAPGLDWQPDLTDTYAAPVDRSVKMMNALNVTSEVLFWTYTYPTPMYPFGIVNASTGTIPNYHAANELYKTRTKDEERNEVIEYKDKEGRLVLKRVQSAGGTPAINDTDYASTYYVYDDFGSLVCVIPPEATKQLVTEYYQSAATDLTKDSFLKRWAFRYAYDARKRMTMKHVPGAEPVYMVYDSRDRLVLTQDGNQRTGATSAIKYWTFTKYDELNRPILTGIKDTTTATQLTQAQMQGVVDLYYSEIPTKPWRKYGEKYVGTAAANNVHGYTNYSYPRVTSAATLNVNNYLTVTYYDNYIFRNDWLGSYAYLSDALTNTSLTGTYTQVATGLENNRLVGQVTGSKIKVLDGGITGGSTWLKSINYYDDKYRTIQTQSDNYKGGIDRISNLYDFSGKVLKSKSTHVEMDITWKDIIGSSVTGNKITRTAAGTSWNVSGAASLQQLTAGQDGWMEVIVSENNLYRMIGLSDANTDPNFSSIDYAWSMTNTGQLMIYESGTSRGTFGPYVPGDILRIERIGTSVKYYRNGILKHPSTVASTSLLMVDAAFYDFNSSVAGVRTSFSNTSKSITRTLEYDHAGRQTKTWHQIDNGTNFLLSKNDYNELGQLIDKKLHSTVSTASDAKQSVDYRYNIRGWLSSMNNASLTADATNDDATDYFGMSLSYNTVDADLTNAPLYNGNIAAMKWSNYPGTGTTKQKGYTYTYDAMNRIAGSVFKEKTTSWAAAANSGFAETGYSYDLNGNIKTMQRNDKRATGWMDNMTYNYGSGTTQSNRLLKVEDTGDDFAGFVDGNAGTTDDYTYDTNGNLTRDLNKGIGTSLADATNIITYNFLNLPETITKGGNSVRYIYDATGRKLSQVVTTGAAQKQTDYIGEFTYENDALQYISHEEGRVMVSSTKLIYTNSFDALTTDITSIGTTVAAYAVNGQKYVSVKSNNTTTGNGIFPIGSTFNVVAGDRYRVRAKGYRTTNAVYVRVKAGTTVLSNATLPNNLANEGWVEQIVTIPAGFTTMQAGLVWGGTVALNEMFYLNEFEITKLETTTPEYQYNLKDHLGNVRLTFTTKQETDAATATLEAANENVERSKFLRYDNARKVNHYLFDHTNGSTPTTTTGAAQRLSGKTNEVYGLARSLSVMPGDVINMEVYGKYIDSNTANLTTALNTLVSQIAAGTAPGGTVIDGSNYGSSTSSFPFPGGLNGTTSSSGAGPKAYLNWLVYDRSDNLILSKCGYQRLTTAAREYGQDAAHEKLSGTVSIAEAGYVYIYLSNEEGTNPYEVYFDDFKVDHIKSPVIQTDDYYPFGLTYNSYSRENSVPNDIKFQGQEHVDDLGLNWDSFKWRNHQPDIGRFFNIDPLADKYVHNSPYAFSENKVVVHVELEGLEAEGLQGSWEHKAIEGARNIFNGKTITETVKSLKENVKEFLREGDKWVNGLQKGAESVKDKQRNGDGVIDGNVDGNRPQEFNKDGTAEGGKGGKEVKTSSESNMKVQNPDKPSADIKIDTTWSEEYKSDSHVKDSTTYTQKYKTSDGQEGEKVIKKVKGSTPWF